MTTKSTRIKIMIFNIIAIILFFLAIAWNIKASGIYNLEIAIGALALGLIKIIQEFYR